MSLFSVLFGAALAAGACWLVMKYREDKTRNTSLADLLGYAYLVDEGVILMKDGGLTRSWKFRGPDLSSATQGEANNLSRHLNDALKHLGTGWTINVDSIRRPSFDYISAERSHFESEVLDALDETRRRRFASGEENFVTENYLTLTYLPQQKVYSWIQDFFIEEEKPDDTGDENRSWENVKKEFLRECEGVERRLSSVLSIEPLGSEEQLTFLHQTITTHRHTVNVPPDGSFLDGVLASEHLKAGMTPEIGEKCLRPIAIQGLPMETRPGESSFLDDLPFSFRSSVRYMPYDRRAAKKELARKRDDWWRKRKGAQNLVSDDDDAADNREEFMKDQDAGAMGQESADAIAEVTANRASFGAYTSVILVAEDTAERADYVANKILAAVRDEGYTARIESINALDAYLGTLPGHGSYNLRQPLISSKNLADLIPATAIWPGKKENPSQYIPDGPAITCTKTAGSTPFRLNLHDGDVGHTLCVGATGTGKSVAIGLIAAQWMRYERSQCYIFDVGHSHRMMQVAAGGQHYDIGAGKESKIRLQPLRHIDRPEERQWAVDWLDTMLDLQGHTVTAEERSVIGEKLKLLGKENPPGQRRLSNLHDNLPSVPEVQMHLAPYLADGPYGQILDSDEDSISDGGFQVFEIERLVEKSDKICVPVLTYLFRRIEQQLDGSKPTLIVIEEAWAALMRSTFADQIKVWLNTLRKKNAAVMLAGHSLSQFNDDSIKNGEMLVSSCPTRILLPNPDATNQRDLYKDVVGLNDREIKSIASAKKKQDYYISSPAGSRMIQLGLGATELAWMGNAPDLSMKETIEALGEVKKEHGKDWPQEWLRLNGADFGAEVFEEVRARRSGRRKPSGQSEPADFTKLVPGKGESSSGLLETEESLSKESEEGRSPEPPETPRTADAPTPTGDGQKGTSPEPKLAEFPTFDGETEGEEETESEEPRETPPEDLENGREAPSETTEKSPAASEGPFPKSDILAPTGEQAQTEGEPAEENPFARSEGNPLGRSAGNQPEKAPQGEEKTEAEAKTEQQPQSPSSPEEKPENPLHKLKGKQLLSEEPPYSETNDPAKQEKEKQAPTPSGAGESSEGIASDVLSKTGGLKGVGETEEKQESQKENGESEEEDATESTRGNEGNPFKALISASPFGG